MHTQSYLHNMTYIQSYRGPRSYGFVFEAKSAVSSWRFGGAKSLFLGHVSVAILVLKLAGWQGEQQQNFVVLVRRRGPRHGPPIGWSSQVPLAFLAFLKASVSGVTSGGWRGGSEREVLTASTLGAPAPTLGRSGC